jgi:hypothetical protein
MEEAATRHVRVTLRYFDGCPNWQTTYDRTRDVLTRADPQSRSRGLVILD